VGKLTEALEWVERARGHLYSFHQQMGHADAALGGAIDALAEAGAHGAAGRLTAELLGRDVLPGRWTFRIVEEFDDGYWSVFRAEEARVRAELTGGVRHLLEAGMRADEQARAAAARRALPS
jgi:hypothetical protein